MKITAPMIEAEIRKGGFDPHIRLTNVSTAYFQSLNNRPAKSLFPVVPVQLSTSSYYRFSKEDLLRDNVRKKPQYGTVDPFQVSHDTDVYSCEVYQIKTAVDRIDDVNYRRAGAPAIITAQNSKSRVLAEQMAIHFKTGVWADEWTGKDDSNVSGKEFIKFTNGNSDPIKFFRERIRAMQRATGRKPNKLGLGADTFDALVEHPAILERISGASSTNNPALADENLLATLFGIKKVVVFDSIENKAEFGAEEDMDFICDPKAALLVHAPDSPAIDQAAAGYIFTWDMLGNGQTMPILTGQGKFGTFTDEILGMMAYDMKVVCNDLGMFMSDCV